jgi:hypothetical protein
MTLHYDVTRVFVSSATSLVDSMTHDRAYSPNIIDYRTAFLYLFIVEYSTIGLTLRVVGSMWQVVFISYSMALWLALFEELMNLESLSEAQINSMMDHTADMLVRGLDIGVETH